MCISCLVNPWFQQDCSLRVLPECQSQRHCWEIFEGCACSFAEEGEACQDRRGSRKGSVDFKPVWLDSGFGWQVELEFDFQREARVMDQVADNLQVTQLSP